MLAGTFGSRNAGKLVLWIPTHHPCRHRCLLRHTIIKGNFAIFHPMLLWQSDYRETIFEIVPILNESTAVCSCETGCSIILWGNCPLSTFVHLKFFYDKSEDRGIKFWSPPQSWPAVRLLFALVSLQEVEKERLHSFLSEGRGPVLCTRRCHPWTYSVHLQYTGQWQIPLFLFGSTLTAPTERHHTSEPLCFNAADSPSSGSHAPITLPSPARIVGALYPCEMAQVK